MRHWTRHAGEIAPFTNQPTPQRYHRCHFDSASLATRLPTAAAEHGTDESTVLLAACFVALSRTTGRSHLGIRQLVANRFRSGLSTVVAPLTRFGLCALPIPPTFPAAVRAVARAGPTEPLFLHVDRVPGGLRLLFDVDTACFSLDAVSALAGEIVSVV